MSLLVVWNKKADYHFALKGIPAIVYLLNYFQVSLVQSQMARTDAK